MTLRLTMIILLAAYIISIDAIVHLGVLGGTLLDD